MAKENKTASINFQPCNVQNSENERNRNPEYWAAKREKFGKKYFNDDLSKLNEKKRKSLLPPYTDEEILGFVDAIIKEKQQKIKDHKYAARGEKTVQGMIDAAKAARPKLEAALMEFRKKEKAGTATLTDLYNLQRLHYYCCHGQQMAEGTSTVIDKLSKTSKTIRRATPIREWAGPVKDLTTLEQMENLGLEFEGKHGPRLLQIDLHRDETYNSHVQNEDENGDPIVAEPISEDEAVKMLDNYTNLEEKLMHLREVLSLANKGVNVHGHEVYDWYNWEKGCIYNLKADAMRDIQDMAAKHLKMDRGKPSPKKHLDILDERAVQQAQEYKKLEEEYAKISKKRKSFETMVKNLNSDKQKIDDEISDLRNKLNLNQNANVPQILAAIREKEKKRADIEEKLKDKSEKLAKSEAELKTVESNKETSKKEYDAIVEAKALLSKELETATSQRDQAITDKSNAENEREKALEDKAKAERDRNTAILERNQALDDYQIVIEAKEKAESARDQAIADMKAAQKSNALQLAGGLLYKSDKTFKKLVDDAGMLPDATDVPKATTDQEMFDQMSMTDVINACNSRSPGWGKSITVFWKTNRMAIVSTHTSKRKSERYEDCNNWVYSSTSENIYVRSDDHCWTDDEGYPLNKWYTKECFHKYESIEIEWIWAYYRDNKAPKGPPRSNLIDSIIDGTIALGCLGVPFFSSLIVAAGVCILGWIADKAEEVIRQLDEIFGTPGLVQQKNQSYGRSR